MSLKIRAYLLAGGSLVFFLFALFSYAVKKKLLNQIDFDTTVRLQDNISRRVDTPFSLFSLFGSFEVTTVIIVLLGIFFLIKFRKLYFGLGLFFVAIFIELLGKLFVHHPSPPFFMLRFNLGFNFPQYYVHTQYSYPSGHMLRTAFLATVFIFFLLRKLPLTKLKWIILALIIGFSGIMFVSRVYLAEHWFSDVFGGVLLGVSFALLSLALFPSGHKKLPI